MSILPSPDSSNPFCELAAKTNFMKYKFDHVISTPSPPSNSSMSS